MYSKYRNFIKDQNAGTNYNNYAGPQVPGAAPVKKIDSFNRTFSIQIVNATNVDADYVVLGYNENGDGATAGSDAGVTINVKKSSHARLKRETAVTGFTFIKWKYRVTSATQISEEITVRYADSTGRIVEDTVFPDNYDEPGNQKTTLLDILDIWQSIDGYTEMKGTILAGVTMTWILTVSRRTRLINANDDMNVVEATEEQAPSGMAPVRIQAAQPASAPSSMV